MATTPTEDFDIECMCGLIDDNEQQRIQSLEKLIFTYRKPLFGYIRKQFPSFSIEDAEDIVQQVFRFLWKKVEDAEFDGNGSLKSLLFTIAKRLAIDELRKRKCQKRTEWTDDEISTQMASLLDGTEVARAWKRATERQELVDEIMNIFRDFLMTLPLQQKLVAEAMYVNIATLEDNVALIQVIKGRSGKMLTALQVKGAKQALTDKFRQILKTKGLLCPH